MTAGPLFRGSTSFLLERPGHEPLTCDPAAGSAAAVGTGVAEAASTSPRHSPPTRPGPRVPARAHRTRVGRQLRRASEIATLLSASGFDWVVEAVGLRSCVSLRCRLHCATGFEMCTHHVDMAQPLPQRMRLVLERLGPTFVKAGQMLALRPDYVPLAYADALRSLHDGVPPFPSDAAKRVIEDELGAPIDVLFAEFDPTPFAAASLSQVHRAVLADGRVVAVKVQRPGIEEQMEADLALLAFLARRVERRKPQALAFRPSAAVAELAEYTRRELDFRMEARTATHIARLLADDPDVFIPTVDPEFSSRRVLTMTFVDGVRPAPSAELEQEGIDARLVLAAGARAMLQQIFVHGVFHADPHPGNLLFQAPGRVCFLDFGMFGRLDRRERRRMAIVLLALIEGDYAAAADQLVRVSQLRSVSDPAGFRAAAAAAAEEWFEAESSDYSVARLLLRQLSLGATHGVVFPRELMLLARSLVNLEATAGFVDPTVTLAELTRPLLPELHDTLRLSPEALWDGVHANRFEYLALALDLPDLAAALMARLQLGAAGLEDPPDVTPRPRVRWQPLAGAGVLGVSLGGWLARRRPR